MLSNLQLRRHQLHDKKPDIDPIVVDDIDPTSKWVEESHPKEFDVDFDIDAIELRREGRRGDGVIQRRSNIRTRS